MRPEMFIYRLGNILFRKKIPLFPALFSYLNRMLFGCWIPSSASIGSLSKTGYWGMGVVIHSNAVIGDNCLISQNVTIGRNKKIKGVPRIGNNVYIASGAVIAGDIKVGDNVIIGANSFVNKDVPSGVIVAGCPARSICPVKKDELRAILGGWV